MDGVVQEYGDIWAFTGITVEIQRDGRVYKGKLLHCFNCLDNLNEKMIKIRVCIMVTASTLRAFPSLNRLAQILLLRVAVR
jgi:hypothetical protein